LAPESGQPGEIVGIDDDVMERHRHSFDVAIALSAPRTSRR
jgi:hypothetical protein